MAIRFFSDPVQVLSIGRNPIQVLLIRSDPVRVLSMRSDLIRSRFCQRPVISLSRDKMSNGSREKPICKNELIDFGGH